MSKFIKFTKEVLEVQHLTKLREIGRQIGVKAPAAKNKNELVKDIIGIQNGKIIPEPQTNRGAPTKIFIDVSEFYDKPQNYCDEPIKSEIVLHDVITDKKELPIVEGVLEQHVSGYGFLRANNYENSRDDAYVSLQNIRRYNLRRGDKVKAYVKVVKEGETAAVQEVISVNDLDPKIFLERDNFDDLIPYYPTERIKLETDSNAIALRCIDLFAPLGMGQRGLIVAPPKTGKTTLLKMIAQSIEKNHKDVKLIVLLIDERPEEVTDIKRSVKGEVVFSTFDENSDHHIRAAELVINRAKRLVEVGKNVVILMDSVTRLARAYNNTVESSGKTLSGGLDPAAMYGPKRFFGAARNIENGGSLTILSTALIETGSRMDDVIYEEFKGTGNMEIHLSRELSERRIFPAIDLNKSGTRREELLLSQKELETTKKLRKFLSERADATDTLIDMLKKTKDNEDLAGRVDPWLKLYSK